MSERFYLALFAIAAIAGGIAQLLRPKYFVERNKRSRLMNALEPFAFLYKRPDAERIVRFFGAGSVFIGLVAGLPLLLDL